MSLPVKAYRRVQVAGGERPRGEGGFIAKFRVFLRDRPGALDGFSSFIARNGGNIGFFHYDRSVDAHRVAVEVQFRNAGDLRGFLQSLAGRKGLFSGPRTSRDDVQIIALENVLEIKVRLVNKPGTLAAFARLLKKQEANVIYMLYDEDIDAEAADVAIATESPDKVDALLGVLNGAGYRYRVLYRGTEEEKFGHVIGLKQVEKFFLRLRDLIGDADLEDVRSLVSSSQDLYSDLVRFYEEAGNDLEAGDVFEEVLALASMAVSRTGGRFAAVGMLP
ncbi:MAG TPA: MBL fold metallo-hydrolase, partial [Sumerlaeia bacterium]|nr:MBL fold metallo-hydrolase [Sumerlaeia bacterium]